MCIIPFSLIQQVIMGWSVLTDDEYESSMAIAKELKMPTDSISRIIKGSVNQSYLKFLERYKMLCNNEIAWENKYIESVDEAIELFVKHAKTQSNSSQSGNYKTDNKSNDIVTTCIMFLSRNNELDRLSHSLMIKTFHFVYGLRQHS